MSHRIEMLGRKDPLHLLSSCASPSQGKETLELVGEFCVPLLRFRLLYIDHLSEIKLSNTIGQEIQPRYRQLCRTLFNCLNYTRFFLKMDLLHYLYRILEMANYSFYRLAVACGTLITSQRTTALSTS